MATRPNVRKLALTGVIVLVALAGTFARGFASNPDTDYGGGTISGLSWTGRSYLSWTTGDGGVVYSGSVTTWINNYTTIEQITADSWGNEYCGPFIIDTDWEAHPTEYDDWFAYGSGGGWAMVGECSWWTPGPYVVLATDSAHNLWDGPDHDRDETSAWDQTPF